MNRIKWFLIFSVIAASCENRDSSELQSSKKQVGQVQMVTVGTPNHYFETDDILFDTLKNRIAVTINNSKLLEGKKQKMGSKWANPEPWVSVFATQQIGLLPSNIDTLVYTVVMDGAKSKYVYSVRQLKKANDDISIVRQFVGYLNNEEYEMAKPLLSNAILKKYNEKEIVAFLNGTFDKKTVEKVELIGTKIVGNNYSYYINFWYSPTEIQTYGFVFFEGDNKIAGIQIPK